MVKTIPYTFLTDSYNKYVLITEVVENAVEKSGIKNGIINIVSKHTTTGIMVNEALECLESDIDEFLKRMIPEEHPYAHARMLRNYGSTAGNPTGHLKSLMTGNHAHLILEDGQILRGEAQEVYFCEFDGPAKRTILIQVVGE
ncbi:MAG: secondary thiamine-phosphate synthase enzyme YjbQ [Suipraeoptans sp.]